MAGVMRPESARRLPPVVGRATVFLCAIAALAVTQIGRPQHQPPAPTLEQPAGLVANASLNAFGNSRGVRLRFALPRDDIEFPIEVSGDPSELTYQWLPFRDSLAEASPRPVEGAS